MLIIRFLISLFAIALIVFGIIAMLTPIPLGFVIVTIGVVILALANPHARPLLKWLRKKWPWLNRKLHDAEKDFPQSISEPLKETEPENDHDKD